MCGRRGVSVSAQGWLVCRKPARAQAGRSGGRRTVRWRPTPTLRVRLPMSSERHRPARVSGSAVVRIRRYAWGVKGGAGVGGVGVRGRSRGRPRAVANPPATDAAALGGAAPPEPTPAAIACARRATKGLPCTLGAWRRRSGDPAARNLLAAPSLKGAPRPNRRVSAPPGRGASASRVTRSLPDRWLQGPRALLESVDRVARVYGRRDGASTASTAATSEDSSGFLAASSRASRRAASLVGRASSRSFRPASETLV